MLPNALKGKAEEGRVHSPLPHCKNRIVVLTENFVM